MDEKEAAKLLEKWEKEKVNIDELKREIEEIWNIRSLRDALLKAVEYLNYGNVTPTGSAEEGLREILSILKVSQ